MQVLGDYVLFCSQLEEVTAFYPHLKISTDPLGLRILKGILDIPNDDHKIVESFLIEIHFSLLFPYRFPVLYETGQSIEPLAQWHKFPDDSCCITVTPHEKLLCRNGISVLSFIRKHAVPYFANQVHYKITGQYKNGEYAHSEAESLQQFYTDLLKTNDGFLWRRYFSLVFIERKILHDRNAACLCGSAKKYKSCHLPVFKILEQLGPEQVASDLQKITGHLI